MRMSAMVGLKDQDWQNSRLEVELELEIRNARGADEMRRRQGKGSFPSNAVNSLELPLSK